MKRFQHWISRSQAGQTGQGMVEFALVMPMLLVLTFGIIELGRLFAIYASVTSASREAARYASASGDSENGVPYYLDCEGIRAAAKRVAILTGFEDGDITILYDHGPNTEVFSETCPATDPVTLGDRVVVQIASDYEPILGFVALKPFTIFSTASRSLIKDMTIGGAPPAAAPTNTSTATATASPTPTATPTETPTNTPTPTQTDTPTPGPSPTPTQTFTLTPKPTFTPTFTATPTATDTPTSTPTPTNTPNPCLITSGSYSDAGPKIIWNLTNNAQTTYTLIRLNIPWGSSNQPAGQTFLSLTLDTSTLWRGEDDADYGGTSFGESTPAEFIWIPMAPSFTLEIGAQESLIFEFSKNHNSVTNATIAVFRNDTTQDECPVSVVFSK